MEAKAGDIRTAPQPCTQVSYGRIVCHWLVRSTGSGFGYLVEGNKVGAITPDLIVLLP